MSNNNNKEQRDAYNRAIGIDGRIGEEEQPVLDSVSPMTLIVAALIIVAFLGLLGWGVMIVFGT